MQAIGTIMYCSIRFNSILPSSFLANNINHQTKSMFKRQSVCCQDSVTFIFLSTVWIGSILFAVCILVYLFVAFLFSSTSHWDRIIKYLRETSFSVYTDKTATAYSHIQSHCVQFFDVQRCKRNPYTRHQLSYKKTNSQHTTSIHLCHSLFHLTFLGFYFVSTYI